VVGWLDRNPGTGVTMVKRHIGNTIQTVIVPTAIKTYNDAMQGIDHHDQLHQTFSLSN